MVCSEGIKRCGLSIDGGKEINSLLRDYSFIVNESIEKILCRSFKNTELWVEQTEGAVLFW